MYGILIILSKYLQTLYGNRLTISIMVEKSISFAQLLNFQSTEDFTIHLARLIYIINQF